MNLLKISYGLSNRFRNLFIEKEQHLFDTAGKTAVITDGTSGIGLATADAFLREGAKVVIAARNEKRGAEALAHLKGISDTVAFRKTDTSDEEDVKALVVFAVDAFGSLNIMYNNAGIGDMTAIDQMTGETFRKLIDINLTGVFYGIKYAALKMEKQGTGGAIVNTSSIEGYVGDSMLSLLQCSQGRRQPHVPVRSPCTCEVPHPRQYRESGLHRDRHGE